MLIIVACNVPSILRLGALHRLEFSARTILSVPRRVVSIVDIHGAVTSEHPYQKTRTLNEALAILYDLANTHIKIEIVEDPGRVPADNDLSRVS
jgi:hypothetical protein